MEHTKYTYRVIWSAEDAEHVGLCTEFPSLSWLDPDPTKALAGILDVVQTAVADMQAAGEPVPEPLSERKFSGNIAARVTPLVHRRLAMEAAEKGISMNRLISAKLAM